MDTEDLLRIAKLALRELGAGDPPLTITADGQPDRWRLEDRRQRSGDPDDPRRRRHDARSHIREQIFNQFAGR